MAVVLGGRKNISSSLDLLEEEPGQGSEGNVLSTSGPLLTKDLDPKALDYDSYWDPDIKANIDGFELLSQAEYKELLKQTGFFIQESQRSIFDQMSRTKRLCRRRRRE